MKRRVCELLAEQNFFRLAALGAGTAVGYALILSLIAGIGVAANFNPVVTAILLIVTALLTLPMTLVVLLGHHDLEQVDSIQYFLCYFAFAVMMNLFSAPLVLALLTLLAFRPYASHIEFLKDAITSFIDFGPRPHAR